MTFRNDKFCYNFNTPYLKSYVRHCLYVDSSHFFFFMKNLIGVMEWTVCSFSEVYLLITKIFVQFKKHGTLIDAQIKNKKN